MASIPEGEANLYTDDLKRKTRQSVLWTVCRIASDQVFTFIVFVILARLLSPHEIGIFALATAFSEIGRVIAINGLTQNIARERTMTPALADTVFWTNLAMSLLVALIVLAGAPPLFDLIDQPDATAPMQALGFVLPIAALGATHLALRLRAFGHKSLAMRSIVAGTIGGIAAIAAALAGWGVWALVVQRFVTEIINTLMSWQAHRWLPGLSFSRRELIRIAGFGANVTVTNIIGLMQRRAQDVVIGTMIGAAAVGLYRVAWRTSELITVGTIQPFTNVALQTLSRLQDDAAGIVKAYRWMVSMSSMVTFPALIGFGVIAPDAVPAIYGPQWVEAGRLAQVFALLVLPVPLASFAIPLLTALGRAADVRTQAIITMSLTVLVTVLAAPYGIFAVACAYVGRTYLTLPMQLWFTRRATGIAPRDTLEAIAAPLAASLIMGAAVWLLMEMIRPYLATPLMGILVAVTGGVMMYAAAILLLSPQARHIARRSWSFALGKR